MKPRGNPGRTYPKNGHKDYNKSSARGITVKNLKNAVSGHKISVLVLDDEHLTLSKALLKAIPDCDIAVVEKDKETFLKQRRVCARYKNIDVHNMDLHEVSVDGLRGFEAIIADRMGNLAQTDFAKFCRESLGDWMRFPSSVFLSVTRSCRGSQCGTGSECKPAKPYDQDRIFAQNISADLYDPETGQMLVGDMSLMQVQSWNQKGSKVMHALEFVKGYTELPLFDKYVNKDPNDTSEHWVGYGTDSGSDSGSDSD